MMYLIFDNQGVIKEKQINELIVQGSNNVNKIGVVIEGTDTTSYAIVGVCKLPNGEIVTTLPSDQVAEVLPGVNGVIFSLSKDITALEGTLKINIQAISLLTDKIITSYTVYLLVNEGVEPGAVVMMTNQQYQTLVSLIQKDIQIDETIVKLTSLPTEPSDYENGQCVFVCDSTHSTAILYQKESGTWQPLYNFNDHYNKTEIDSLLNAKLDKKTTSGTSVYAHNGTIQNEYPVTSPPTANSIPIRGADGRLYVVETPIYAAEATSKYYVDNGLAQKSKVTGTERDGKWDSLTIDGVTHLIDVGGNYTAGTGISISGDDVISVDTSVVATQSDLQDVREVAEGKCKTLILSFNTNLPSNDQTARQFKKIDGTAFTDLAEFNSYVSGLTYINSDFNSQISIITEATTSYLIDAKFVVWKYADIQANFKQGDIFLITETDVPDRWIGYLDGPFILYRMETTKIDIENYYTKTETNGLLATKFSAVSTYSVGEYVIYNGTLYRCISDIETASAWNPSYWTSVKVANEMVDKASPQTITGLKTFNNGIITKEVAFDLNPATNYIRCDVAGILLRAGGNDFRIQGRTRPQEDNVFDLGRQTLRFKDGYFGGQVYAQNTFNVINATDIVDNTLTQDQYDLITNGKPTLIKGTFLSITNPFLISGGIAVGSHYFLGIGYDSSGVNAFIHIQLLDSTKSIGARPSTAPAFNANGIFSINGKVIPAYPSSPTSNQVLTYKTNNTLDWVDASPGGMYQHTIKISHASLTGADLYIVLHTSDSTPYTGWGDISNLQERVASCPLRYALQFGYLTGVVSTALYSLGSITISGWYVDDRTSSPTTVQIASGIATFVSDSVIPL